MKTLNKIKTHFLLNLIFILSASAQVKLPAIVSSDMVLQRNTTVNLWGWAASSEKISIKTSWNEKEIDVTTNNEGVWQMAVETTDSKEPQTIQIKSKTSSILLENILFGEVWLCSGQSNMEMKLKGYPGQPIFGSTKAIIHANNPNLRLFTVGRTGSKTPLQDFEDNKGWVQSTPETAANFSAVAYFFGHQLQEILGVPVGLINTSYGASPVQAWMSKESLNNFQTINLEDFDVKDKPNKIPTALFNAMLHPIIPYKIKGAIWYQGEANRLDPEGYKNLFPAMVKDWRTRWGIGDFPFYYAQIAPFTYGNNQMVDAPKNSAFIREAQLECVDLIPNSGIAITTDVGDANFIHPPQKKEVAIRLLFNALNQTYDIKAVKYASPTLDSLVIQDNGISLTFKNAELGLYSYKTLNDFEIAGEDKVFYPAEAKIENRRTILVTSEKVTNPVAVRYGWRNYVDGTLFDASLLPVSSFRTDNWNDATIAEKQDKVEYPKK